MSSFQECKKPRDFHYVESPTLSAHIEQGIASVLKRDDCTLCAALEAILPCLKKQFSTLCLTG